VTTNHAASSTLNTRHPFTSLRASSWPLANERLQPTAAGAIMSRRD
jgi:hypothetical protein